MASFYVSNTSDLIKFVGLAKDGDQILLAAGTYSGVSIQNVVKAGNVTIASANALNPAVLTDLMVKNSQGLTFTSLEMFAKADVKFAIESSSRINFDKLDVHGTLNGSSNDDVRGMLVRNSSNVTVTNSYFHELTDAVSHINDTNVTFSGNRFNLIRDNGIAAADRHSSPSPTIASPTSTTSDLFIRTRSRSGRLTRRFRRPTSPSPATFSIAATASPSRGSSSRTRSARCLISMSRWPTT